jgi:hypothetical protein
MCVLPEALLGLLRVKRGKSCRTGSPTRRPGDNERCSTLIFLGLLAHLARGLRVRIK